MSNTPVNSKDGSVPDKDLAGHGPRTKRVFGESPETVSDSGADDPRELENLRQENATAPRG